MNDRSLAIAALCSHLCAGDGVAPLEPMEYSRFAALLLQRGFAPEDLLRFSRQDLTQKLELSDAQADRLIRLIERSAGLGFELSNLEHMGITVLTRADAAYPKKLKDKLVHACPPIFYTAGDLSLLERKAIGYAGSRSINEADADFARSAVRKTTARGYAVVSGGARGSDSIAEETALDAGGTVVSFLSDSMLRRLRNAAALRAVQQGSLLLLSVVKPDAGFNAGIAMMRNKYIYAQSEATLVIKADYRKGGTWTGATENMKNGWALTLCRDHRAYPGNRALIEQGAIPIGEDWDGSIEAFAVPAPPEKPKQLSIFDESGEDPPAAPKD